MAVEGSILNKESIKKIMIEQYGISVEAIKKINLVIMKVTKVLNKLNSIFLILIRTLPKWR